MCEQIKPKSGIPPHNRCWSRCRYCGDAMFALMATLCSIVGLRAHNFAVHIRKACTWLKVGCSKPAATKRHAKAQWWLKLLMAAGSYRLRSPRLLCCFWRSTMVVEAAIPTGYHASNAQTTKKCNHREMSHCGALLLVWGSLGPMLLPYLGRGAPVPGSPRGGW